VKSLPIREIPFGAMGAVYDDDLRAVAEIMQAATRPGGSFFPLPEEVSFQEALGTHEGARKAIAVNSCGIQPWIYA